MRFHRRWTIFSRGHKTHRTGLMFICAMRSREQNLWNAARGAIRAAPTPECGGNSSGMSMNCKAELRRWLGGLDSNQDNQIQNLMYCQLYHLPIGRPQK